VKLWGPARRLELGWDERITEAVTKRDPHIMHFVATFEAYLDGDAVWVFERLKTPGARRLSWGGKVLERRERPPDGLAGLNADTATLLWTRLPGTDAYRALNGPAHAMGGPLVANLPEPTPAVPEARTYQGTPPTAVRGARVPGGYLVLDAGHGRLYWWDDSILPAPADLAPRFQTLEHQRRPYRDKVMLSRYLLRDRYSGELQEWLGFYHRNRLLPPLLDGSYRALWTELAEGQTEVDILSTPWDPHPALNGPGYATGKVRLDLERHRVEVDLKHARNLDDVVVNRLPPRVTWMKRPRRREPAPPAALSWWKRWQKPPEAPVPTGAPVDPKQLAEAAHRMLKYWQGPSEAQFQMLVELDNVAQCEAVIEMHLCYFLDGYMEDYERESGYPSTRAPYEIRARMDDLYSHARTPAWRQVLAEAELRLPPEFPRYLHYKPRPR